MYSRFSIATAISLVVISLIFPAVLACENDAGRGDTTIAKIRSGELDKTPLSSGALQIRITRFRGSVLKVGAGYIGIEVHNASDDFATFSPERLSFLNKDFTQVDLIGRLFGGDKLITLRNTRIAPRASIDEFYQLDHRIELPCRLYYEEKLLAEITD